MDLEYISVSFQSLPHPTVDYKTPSQYNMMNLDTFVIFWFYR